MDIEEIKKLDNENLTEEVIVKLTKYEMALLEVTLKDWYQTKTKSEWFSMIMWTHYKRMAFRIEKGFDEFDEESYKTLKELKQL
tara:strand:+ start:828 stop:1079 length:252 start_codon:yes stop_codon:yes gene_type:complete